MTSRGDGGDGTPEGRWFGRPSLFDAAGSHVGYEYVDTASVTRDGRTTYHVDTKLTGSGPLRNRLQLGGHQAFDVRDDDEHRIYLGPDFHGTGCAYGSFVDAHYYSPGWQADVRTWNQMLDGTTQVYSAVLYDGWAVCGVFNGVYRAAHDYAGSAETRAEVDAWILRETEHGSRPQVLPTKQPGGWSGELEVVNPDREVLGTTLVTIDHEPMTSHRLRHTVEWRGVLNRSYVYERHRDGARTQYDGPDVWGNAMTYGRALFTSQHAHNDPWKIRGREFLVDDSLDLAVVWQVFTGDRLTYVVHGLLRWQPARPVTVD